MFGIADKWVWLVYLLCVASTVLCVVYSWLNWNQGDDTVRPEDVKWAAEERKVEDKL